MDKIMNVAQWMESVGLPYVVDAEKYNVGQNLTEDEAWEIKRYVEFSILCQEGLEDGLGFIFTLPSLHMDQIDMRINLIWYPEVSSGSNWSDALLGTLDQSEMCMLHDIMNSVFLKNENDYPGMSVANWLNVRDLPYIEDAERFIVGQKLTTEDAVMLRTCVAYVLAVCFEREGLYENPEADPEMHCDFVKVMLELIWTDYSPENSNWRSALWSMLKPVDIQMCHEVLRDARA